MRRLPDKAVWPSDLIGKALIGNAEDRLREIPDECAALAVTSPPYWDVVDYGGMPGQIGQADYETYLAQLMSVWKQTARVLIPNGKLAIVTPIMPIPKKVINDQHTRHLKNIAADIEAGILAEIPSLKRLSLFVWQKQTTVKMFGSYPYPPNIYEDNTIEFINVFVKDGAPPPIDAQSKEASRLTQEEWLNLTLQVWPMYPEDVTRAGGHPAPFPLALPLRLIKMYTFARSQETGFDGDLVLDMFNGTGATCVAAKAAEREFIGIDLNPEYCRIAEHRIAGERVDPYAFLLEKPRVRKAKSSRQMPLFDEQPSEPAPSDAPAEYAIAAE